MPPQPLKDRSRRGPYDELWTPDIALDPLFNHAKPSEIGTIWECAPGGANVLGKLLRERGCQVEMGHSDFFVGQPMEWSCIITNPPYSKKVAFIRRAHELGKPWAMLLPVTTLGVKGAQQYMANCEIIFLPKRIDFTGGGAPWFAVAWFTEGFGLGKQIIFDGVKQ